MLRFHVFRGAGVDFLRADMKRSFGGREFRFKSTSLAMAKLPAAHKVSAGRVAQGKDKQRKHCSGNVVAQTCLRLGKPYLPCISRNQRKTPPELYVAGRLKIGWVGSIFSEQPIQNRLHAQ